MLDRETLDIARERIPDPRSGSTPASDRSGKDLNPTNQVSGGLGGINPWDGWCRKNLTNINARNAVHTSRTRKSPRDTRTQHD